MRSEIEWVFAEEYGRAVAVLARVCGDIDIAEEAVQDAFTEAVKRWPSDGLPGEPGRRPGQLLAFSPTPVVALNRAVAVAEVSGPEAALSIVDGLDLDRHHLFQAIRAELLRRLGRSTEAALAYAAAIARTDNESECAFLRRARKVLPD